MSIPYTRTFKLFHAPAIRLPRLLKLDPWRYFRHVAPTYAGAVSAAYLTALGMAPSLSSPPRPARDDY